MIRYHGIPSVQVAFLSSARCSAKVGLSSLGPGPFEVAIPGFRRSLSSWKQLMGFPDQFKVSEPESFNPWFFKNKKFTFFVRCSDVITKSVVSKSGHGWTLYRHNTIANMFMLICIIKFTFRSFRCTSEFNFRIAHLWAVCAIYIKMQYLAQEGFLLSQPSRVVFHKLSTSNTSKHVCVLFSAKIHQILDWTAFI